MATDVAVRYFRRATDDIEPFKGRLMSLLDDSNQHPLVRCLLSEVIAYKGTDSDGEYFDDSLRTKLTHACGGTCCWDFGCCL